MGVLFGSALAGAARINFTDISIANYGNTAGLSLSVPGATGAPVVSPTIVPLANATVVPFGLGTMLFDYYNRIFLLPPDVAIFNARIGIPYTYRVWNAFLTPVTLTSINPFDAGGLTNSLLNGETFAGTQLKEFTITLDGTAGTLIDASYVLDFSQGPDLTLGFTAQTAVLAQYPPDRPIREEIEWLTNVITSRNGTEQRISVRPDPRLSSQIVTTIQADDERVRIERGNLFRAIGQRVFFPDWLQPVVLTAAANSGDQTINVDASENTLAAGGAVFMSNLAHTVGEFLVIGSLPFATQITFTTTLANSYTEGSVIYPLREGLLKDGPKLNRQNYAQHKLTYSPDFQSFVLPLGTSTTRVYDPAAVQDEAVVMKPLDNVVPIYDGYPLVNRFAMGEDSENTFSSVLERVDEDTGVFTDYTRRNEARIRFNRTYLVQNRKQRSYMHRLLTLMAGRSKPALFPTFAPDLELVELFPTGLNTMTITGLPNASTIYFDRESHKRIALQVGPIFYVRKVLASTTLSNGNVSLVLDGALPPTLTADQVDQISFVLLARLNSDTVEVENFPRYATFSLSLVTVEQ